MAPASKRGRHGAPVRGRDRVPPPPPPPAAQVLDVVEHVCRGGLRWLRTRGLAAKGRTEFAIADVDPQFLALAGLALAALAHDESATTDGSVVAILGGAAHVRLAPMPPFSDPAAEAIRAAAKPLEVLPADGGPEFSVSSPDRPEEAAVFRADGGGRRVGALRLRASGGAPAIEMPGVHAALARPVLLLLQDAAERVRKGGSSALETPLSFAWARGARTEFYLSATEDPGLLRATLRPGRCP